MVWSGLSAAGEITCKDYLHYFIELQRNFPLNVLSVILSVMENLIGGVVVTSQPPTQCVE